MEKWKNEGKLVTKESPKSKKPYFGQDMAFLGVKWSQNQILGPKIHLKLVFNHTFFFWKKFQSWFFGFKLQPHHPVWFSLIQKKQFSYFSCQVSTFNYLPVTFIIAIFCVEFKSGLKLLIAEGEVCQKVDYLVIFWCFWGFFQ